MREYLHKNGIQTSVHYPAIHQFSIYQDANVSLPTTEYVTDNIITLPMFGGLTREEVSFICDKLKEGLNELQA
jgi:dTDP-4-amino-4,6-dideoxygalactose transaminase